MSDFGTIHIVIGGKAFALRTCFDQARCDAIAKDWGGVVDIDALEKGELRRAVTDTSMSERAWLISKARALAGKSPVGSLPTAAELADASRHLLTPRAAPDAPAVMRRVLVTSRRRSPRT